MKTFEAKPANISLGAQTIIYELAEEKGNPIKLGDGSFGVVLKVIDPNGIPGAVKLYYSNDDIGVLARNDEEKQLRQKMLAKEKGGVDLSGISGLVIPSATVDNFLESAAYQESKSFFEKAGIKLTGSGVVMEYFDCTLKDLLERGAPEGRESAGRSAKENGKPGYEILRNAEPDERERCVLPILKQLALGLHTLHRYGYYHHDLKPANVLLKAENGVLKVGLGDFGFATPNSVVNTRVVKLKDEAMAEGTRHYRSVEQKDNIDICEVAVEVSEHEIEKPDLATISLVLRTQDAKFFDSIIEAGDICVFRKDSSRRPWFVERIDRTPKDPTFLTTIHLRKEKAFDKQKNRISVFSDPRTQVVFLKEQTHRTDLFGFGAIAFDLITAGCSPERFYDFLRSLDKLQENGEPYDVAAITTAYAAFAAAPSAEPTHRALFNEFRVGSAYPSYDYVNIVLKCMLSKPRDSYFAGDTLVEDSHGKKRKRTPEECFRKLQREVSTLTERSAANYISDDFNPLWTSEKEELGEIAVPSEFGVVLRDHRRRLSSDKPSIALARAYKLLKQVSKTVDDSLALHDPDATRVPYLALLGPDHLKEEGKLDIQSSLFPTEKHYRDALRSGEVVSFGSSTDTNSFLPPRMRYRIRQIALKLMASDKSESKKQPVYRYAYSYCDSTPCWPGIEAGDVVRVWNEQRAVTLFIVNSVSQSERLIDLSILAVQLGEIQEPTPSTVDVSLVHKAEIVKQIRPADYYLGVLAIYVHQLFFYEGNAGFAPLPAKMWWLEQSDNLGFLDRDKMVRSCRFKTPTRHATTGDVQKHAASLYAWLLLRGYETNEGESALQGAELRADINFKIRSLGETIGKVFKKKVEWLEAIVQGTEQVLEHTFGHEMYKTESLSPAIDDFLAKLGYNTWLDPVEKRGLFGWIKWREAERTSTSLAEASSEPPPTPASEAESS